MGGDRILYLQYLVYLISIHTTRVGGDTANVLHALKASYFNPHHPCGWWRKSLFDCVPRTFISIHTTRVGGDVTHACIGKYVENFNPHHPCGWWLITMSIYKNTKNFNPHHPCGWWHSNYIVMTPHDRISIHTTRVGGDLLLVFGLPETVLISIHTTRVGGDSIKKGDTT